MKSDFSRRVLLRGMVTTTALTPALTSAEQPKPGVLFLRLFVVDIL
jgi:hypothetical protein